METKHPSLGVSLAPIIFLISLLVINVHYFKDDASYGPNQLALLLSTAFCMLLGFFILKQPYKEMEQKAMAAVGISIQPMFILLIVGSLISIWIMGGIVPIMIYYGIKLIHPTVFLPVTLVICSVVSLATGSSWSTVGTVGIALIGVGKTLGISEGMVAGAIVSGSYFGDKMSPLSDTTNLAPAMAGAELFEHIKHMLYTTGPAFILALLGFIILGATQSSGVLDETQINQTISAIEANFNISIWLFLLPLGVLFLVMKKVPAIPALAMGVLGGMVFVVIFQGDLLTKMTGEEGNWYKTLIKVAYSGFSISSGNEIIDKLFSRGGMSSMLNTIWLILMALIFGGIMEVTGMLQSVAHAILKQVKSVGSLVGATVGSAIFLNISASDQYISIVVSGRMFKSAFQNFNLHPKNLSRAVEDGGTVTSVLVPWNTCGAYFSSVMGVATLTYLPFAFFNLLSPIISVIVASTGKTMTKLVEEDA